MKSRPGLPRSVRVVATAMANPDLRRLELAFAGFCMAEWATWIAVTVFAYERGGATEAGVVSLAQLAPAAVVAPVAAAFADRLARQRALTLGYVAQAVTMAATAFGMLAGWPAPAVYAFAAAAATSVTFTRPAQGALLPSLARSPAELTASNVASGTIESASFLVGPVLAAALLAAGSPGVVFAVMAGMITGAAMLASRITAGREAAPAAPGTAPSVAAEVREGVRTVNDDPDARLLVALVASQSLVIGALDVLTVVMAIGVLGLGSPGAGLLTAAIGAGGIAGSAAAVMLVGRRRLTPALGGGTLLLGLPLLLIGAVPSVSVSVAMLLTAGAGRAVMDIAGRTLLQRAVRDRVLARVFGLLEGLFMAALAVGSVLAAALVSLVGPLGAIALSGMVLPLLALPAWPRLVRIDAGAGVSQEHLALLGDIEMFGVLPPPTLERLAANLVHQPLPAGAVLMRQGEPGDRFYVVESGRLRVIRDGLPIADTGPGGHVGEIALLRGVPRTATVVAITDATLLGLDRAQFLEAVTGHAGSARWADTIVRQRMSAEPEKAP